MKVAERGMNNLDRRNPEWCRKLLPKMKHVGTIDEWLPVGSQDHLRNDLKHVGWGIKLYSFTNSEKQVSSVMCRSSHSRPCRTHSLKLVLYGDCYWQCYWSAWWFHCRGLVPLHNACSYGHFEVTELLLKVRKLSYSISSDHFSMCPRCRLLLVSCAAFSFISCQSLTPHPTQYRSFWRRISCQKQAGVEAFAAELIVNHFCCFWSLLSR